MVTRLLEEKYFDNPIHSWLKQYPDRHRSLITSRVPAIATNFCFLCPSSFAERAAIFLSRRDEAHARLMSAFLMLFICHRSDSSIQFATLDAVLGNSVVAKRPTRKRRSAGVKSMSPIPLNTSNGEPRGKIRRTRNQTCMKFAPAGLWHEAEFKAVHPQLIVCLGTVPAQSFHGSNFIITQSHGQVLQVEGFPPVLATLYPSAILRAGTHEDREGQMQTFY